MVRSEELDCSRGAHSFWEPATSGPQVNAGQQNVKLPTFENPLKLFTPAFAGAPQGASGMNGGHMMFASSGSGSGSGGGGYDDDDFGYDDDYGYEDDVRADEPVTERPQSNRTRRSAGRANASGGRSRSASVQPEARYWTDYLRIALPVIGIILMLGLLWIWASNLIGDDSNSANDPDDDQVGLVATLTPDPNAVNTQPNAASTPEAPPQGETNTGEIPISNAGQGETTPPGENTTFNPTSTEEPANGGDNQAGEGEGTTTEEEPVDEAPPADGTGEIEIGATVRITEDNVNIRSSASTANEPIGVAMAGDEAVIASGPEEAEDYIWWEVVFDDGSPGFIVQEFLEVVP